MSRTRAGVWSACLAAVLPGCSYTVDVHNATDVPVLVQLVQKQWPNPDWVLDSDRVGAGATIRLGPARVAGGSVVVEAGELTRTREPARMKVGSGRRGVEIAVLDDGSTLTIRELRRGDAMPSPGDDRSPSK